MSSYIGIDLGGTSIKGGRIESGKIVRNEVFPVDTEGTQESIFSDICDLIGKLWTEKVKGIGFAVPAVIDFANGTIYGLSNIPQFNGFAIQKALEEKFGVTVKLQNDANCFVLGEKYFGEAIGYQNIVGLITGTGTGAGLIIDAKLHNGENFGAGELGMIPYLNGCYEDYCSGQFFTSAYQVSGEEMVRHAMNGDSEAMAAFHSYGLHLGSLINLICYVLDPQIVVIGGSVSKSFEWYKSGLAEAMKKFYFDHQVKVIIKPSVMMDIAIYGAVGLFYDSIN
jgi:glucokinase